MKRLIQLTKRLVLPVAGLLLVAPQTARAEWFEASSQHFVVYGDVPNRQALERFVANLERFHAAMAMVTGAKVEPVSPSNRVTIYGVGSAAAVRDLFGARDGAKYVQGFYVPRAGRTVAFVPDITNDKDGMLGGPFKTLLHEYAHHFLIGSAERRVPRWMDEGAAEFFSTSFFGGDGKVQVGRPNPRRMREIQLVRDVTVTDLVDPESYERRRGKAKGYDGFYGKSWLLYHYLNLGGVRQGQLRAYLEQLAAGKSSLAAAEAAFGDLNQLEREIDAYGKRSRLNGIEIRAGVLEAPSAAVRSLRPGEVAMLPVTVQVDRRFGQRGATDAAETASAARAVAAQYGQDAVVQAVLAEAELQAEDVAAALAAADRAVALDPGLVRGQAARLLALLRKAEKSGDMADLAAARGAVVTLNHLENDHPLPLILYHRSFMIEHRPASATALAGLARAVELAPFDLGLRMNLAMEYVRAGRSAEARAHLEPVAYSPHNSTLAEAAGQVLARIENDPKWRGEGGIPKRDGSGAKAD